MEVTKTEKGIPDGSEKNLQPEPIQGSNVVLKREIINDPTEGVALHEAHHDKHQSGSDDE